MRTIPARTVIDAVARMAIDAAYCLNPDLVRALTSALTTEKSAVGIDVLSQIIENARIAAKGEFPVCQDTGLAILFVTTGEDVRVEGGLRAALEEGVRLGYRDGFLRKSVCDSFTRQNTGDNAPPVIHIDLVPGDKLVIDLLAKGGGSENMSRAAVLSPSAGEPGVVEFIIDTVRAGGVNACPPLIVGVGIGGNLEVAATLAKKSLLRRIGEPSADERLAHIESDALAKINELGIGPGGFGGTTTALAVHALAAPSHIASLPVAVILECHAHRHGHIEL